MPFTEETIKILTHKYKSFTIKLIPKDFCCQELLIYEKDILLKSLSIVTVPAIYCDADIYTDDYEVVAYSYDVANDENEEVFSIPIDREPVSDAPFNKKFIEEIENYIYKNILNEA